MEGWENQLDHNVLLNLYGLYAKSFSIFQILEVVPESSVALGNYHTYFQQNFTLRLGLFNQINNSSSYHTFTGATKAKNTTEIFTSLSVFGRISLVDATLSDYLLISEFPRLSYENLRGGYQVKFNVLFQGVGVFVAYNYLTPGTELSSSHGYGTITLSYSW